MKPQDLTRLTHLTAVLDRHWQEIPHANGGPPDELEAFFTPGRCSQFALVSTHAATKPFTSIEPTFPSLLKAIQVSAARLADKQDARTPLAIVNLDTGDQWTPELDRISWAISPPTPIPPPPQHDMRFDRTETDFQPLDGATAKTNQSLYPLTAEIRNSGQPALILRNQVHASAAFAAAWNKHSKSYTAGIPLRGARMTKLVARCVASATTT